MFKVTAIIAASGLVMSVNAVATVDANTAPAFSIDVENQEKFAKVLKLQTEIEMQTILDNIIHQMNTQIDQMHPVAGAVVTNEPKKEVKVPKTV